MCIHIHTYPHTVYHGIELPTTGNRMYVDPTTYSHVDRAVEDFAKEIGPKSIRLTEEIGNGEFGNVYRGIWRTDSKDQLPIAVKTLKVRVSFYPLPPPSLALSVSLSIRLHLSLSLFSLWETVRCNVPHQSWLPPATTS